MKKLNILFLAEGQQTNIELYKKSPSDFVAHQRYTELIARGVLEALRQQLSWLKCAAQSQDPIQ